jgi:hypothetical protein
VSLGSATRSQPLANLAQEARVHWGARACTLIACIILLLVLAKNILASSFADYWAYNAAAMAIRGHGSLYGPALLQRDTGFTLHHPTIHQGKDVPNDYPYPPAFAMALVPFTALPANVQEILWLSILFSCVLGTGYVLSGQLFSVAPRYRYTATLGLSAILILLGPIRLDLALGQVEPVLLLLVSLSLAAFLSRRDCCAGLWLGLAMAVKPSFGFLILFFLWKRAYRAWLIICAVVGASWLVSLPLVGINGISDWIAIVSYWSTPTFAVTPGNQSLYGFLLRLLTVNPFTIPLIDAPWLARLLHGVAVLGTLTLLAMTIRRSRALPPRQQALEYGLACVAMLLVSPVSERIHYGNIAIPLVSIAAAATAILARRWRPFFIHVPVETRPATTRGAQGSPTLRAGVLLLGALAIHGYISLPGIHFLMMGDYKFYQAPLTMPELLLTGALLYDLCALGGLVLLTIRWYPRWSGDAAAGTP